MERKASIMGMERKTSFSGLKRTATWIDQKSLTLKNILKDPRALKAFQDFAASIRAEENIIFWIAVEFFRVSHVSTPKSGETMRKRFSETLKPGDEVTQEMFRIDPRHSVMMDKYMTLEKLGSLELSDSQLALLTDATRVFKTFLEDGGSHWTCIDVHIVDDIRTHLKEGNVDINLFNKAQHQVYQTMLSDLFPRFLKAVKENPLKYSGAERFELPKQSIDDLENNHH